MNTYARDRTILVLFGLLVILLVPHRPVQLIALGGGGGALTAWLVRRDLAPLPSCILSLAVMLVGFAAQFLQFGDNNWAPFTVYFGAGILLMNVFLKLTSKPESSTD